jgi:hypothetical protein
MLFVSTQASLVSFKGGTLIPIPVMLALPGVTDATGSRELGWVFWPGGFGSLTFFLQAVVVDATAPFGVSISNGVAATVP